MLRTPHVDGLRPQSDLRRHWWWPRRLARSRQSHDVACGKWSGSGSWLDQGRKRPVPIRRRLVRHHRPYGHLGVSCDRNILDTLKGAEEACRGCSATRRSGEISDSELMELLAGGRTADARYGALGAWFERCARELKRVGVTIHRSRCLFFITRAYSVVATSLSIC